MIARQISFFAPAAVMSAWATVMLHTIATGHINRLLSPMFRNYVLIAAIALLVLSALYVLLYQPDRGNRARARPDGTPPPIRTLARAAHSRHRRVDPFAAGSLRTTLQ